MELVAGRLAISVRGKRLETRFGFDGTGGRLGVVEVSTERRREGCGEILRVYLKAGETVRLEAIELEFRHAFSPSNRIFLNGFQSWTNSREFRPDERMPGLPRLFRPLYARHRVEGYGDYLFHSYSGKQGVLHGYTYSYVRLSPERLCLLGSLSERAGYTVFDYETTRDRLVVKKECRGVLATGELHAFDLFVGEGCEDELFDAYFAAMAVPRPRVSTTPGWTSWYNYYTNISEEIVLSNAREFKAGAVPIEIFQIDDGYQTAVGDWLSIKPTFPNGMGPVARGIQELGFKAGLWLAPFICEQKSTIVSEHSDWILRDNCGAFIEVGNNDLWSGLFYPLDLYHPGVRDYLKRVFDTVLNDWGFDMVKLDFLHAVAVAPRSDKTRGQIMCEAMDLLRELCGDKLILGCGVPLGPAFGKVDYCRVGPDVHLEWEEVNAAKIHYRERISTINSIGNAIGRRHLNGRAFVSDPDVFILRSENNRLSDVQKKTLFLVNCIFGDLLFMSDFLGSYSASERARYLSLYPVARRRITSVVSWDEVYRWTEPSSLAQLLGGVRPYANLVGVEFEIDAPTGKRRYLAAFNLGGKLVAIDLPEGEYWNGRIFLSGGSRLNLPPFDSVCLYRREPGATNEILGDETHVFPGCNVGR